MVLYKRNKKYLIIIFFGVLITTVLFTYYLTQNSGKISPNRIVVAHIGPKTITARDFILNYEFGYPQLKKSGSLKGHNGVFTKKMFENWKRSYLNFMIDEKILALQGYKLGLDKSKHIQELQSELMSDIGIKALIKKEVSDKIKITQKEINNAINKSKVSFKLDFWVAPTFEQAENARKLIKVYGFKKSIGKLLKQSEIQINPNKFQTKYLTWLDIDPRILNTVKNLPVHKISKPILLNGFYYLFQVVGIRRKSIMNYEYLSKYTTYRKILYNMKLKAGVHKYVENFMITKDVVTKIKPFKELANALAEWKLDNSTADESFRKSVHTSNPSQKARWKLKHNLNKIIVTYDGGNLTVNQFLNLFYAAIVKYNPQEGEDEFINRVNKEFAITIRDYLLSRESKRLGLLSSPWVQHQLKIWKDKWVYEATRQYYTDSLKLSKNAINKYFNEHKSKYKINKKYNPNFKSVAFYVRRDAYDNFDKSILYAKIDSLKKIWPVKINYEVLDTLKVVNFNKSRWAFVDLFEGGTGRPAIPIVDVSWAY